YRIQSDRKVAICSVHPFEQATLQCLGCVKAKIHVAKSYHCSPRCFSDAWQHHRTLHERATSAVNENDIEEEELFGRFNTSRSGASNVSLSSSTPKKKLHVGHANTILTSQVIPPPTPSPRHLVPVNGVDVMGNLDLGGHTFGNLLLCSHTIFSDVYASNDLYSYCPSWAYRETKLIMEIVGYRLRTSFAFK
ncbi:hypothetical protein IFM89_032774, partial [Coptis chinensis]